MKKLKLSLSKMEGVEVLTTAQIKNVIGGSRGEVLGNSCSTLMPCQPHLICHSLSNTCQYPHNNPCGSGSGSGCVDDFTLRCGV